MTTSKHKWDASMLRLVTQHLRVPELFYPYTLGSEDALTEQQIQTQGILDACKFEGIDQEQTLLKQLQTQFGDKGVFTQASNLAFLLDRAFDVWLRKNSLPELLVSKFSKWRFAYYRAFLIIYCSNLERNVVKNKEAALYQITHMLESIIAYAKCWSPLPKRSQSLLLDQLANIESMLDLAQEFDIPIAEKCSNAWFEFLEKQADKVEKVTTRLIVSEAKKNTAQYSLWLAYHYLNVLFSKRNLPQVLQDFLQEHWVYVVAKSIEDTLPDDIETKHAIVINAFNPSLDTLCKNIVRVFCHKGESGFQLADQIIDDMQKKSQENSVLANTFISASYSNSSAFFSEESAWEALSGALVSLLQGQNNESIQRFKMIDVPEHLQEIYGRTEQFSESNLSFENLSISLGDWFVLKDEGTLINIKVSANFQQSQQLLFSNYLGMKCAQFSYAEFKEKLNNGSLSRQEKKIPLSSVIQQAIKGLAKIADNQKKTRLMAAEKAKAEAERLLEDKRKADEISNQRAEEIAQRTQQLMAKRADKQRLEKEKAILALIRGFKLGAWVALHAGGESQRFKLVVKLAATGKYVFVDRLGVKKLEFLELDLMDAIQTERIEVLSDGAEFEDSLQRVVSRLRISKQG